MKSNLCLLLNRNSLPMSLRRSAHSRLFSARQIAAHQMSAPFLGIKHTPIKHPRHVWSSISRPSKTRAMSAQVCPSELCFCLRRSDPVNCTFQNSSDPSDPSDHLPFPMYHFHKRQNHHQTSGIRKLPLLCTTKTSVVSTNAGHFWFERRQCQNDVPRQSVCISSDELAY
jgi:hypothetical protein